MPSIKIILPIPDDFSILIVQNEPFIKFQFFRCPRFTIHHVTKYRYNSPVRDSASQIILYPIRDEYQDVVRQDLHVSGDPEIEVFRDYYGNEVGSFTHADPHTELVIDSKVEVITYSAVFPADGQPGDEQWAEIDRKKYQPPYIDFLNLEKFDGFEELMELSLVRNARQSTPLQAARLLNEMVYNDFKYIKGITSVETTLDEIWKLKAGVCQDFAHILLIMLRGIGIPARYVSGYVCPNKNGMRGEGATHAWVEAWMPGFGWLGLDPTNNCFANDLHVRLAVGHSFNDCSPVKGAYKGISEHTLEVGVSVFLMKMEKRSILRPPS